MRTGRPRKDGFRARPCPVEGDVEFSVRAMSLTEGLFVRGTLLDVLDSGLRWGGVAMIGIVDTQRKIYFGECKTPTILD